MEILSIMKGDITKVPNVGKRSKEFVTQLLGNQSRGQFVKESIERLSPLLYVPEEVKESVFEEFDPVLCAIDVIELNLKRIVNSILDFEGDDQGFYEMMKDVSERFIAEWIDETEGGF
jgi:hypothetical protein